MAEYDYLIVGSGLFGAVFAQRAAEDGKRCLVLERRPHIGGNIYTQEVEGIAVHRYGPHILHTNNPAVWAYLSRFASFNHYINAPIANYKGEIYSLPFNMYTFYAMWGARTPQEAQAYIAQQRQAHGVAQPQNLEQIAQSLVGNDIYEKLIKGYTEKQWGRPCAELPASIIQRLPVRFTYNNNYFDAVYQGIPTGGYTAMAQALLAGAEVRLHADYLHERDSYRQLADTVIYTGAIDEYFGYRLGPLQYRSVSFKTEVKDTDNFQGNAVVNYTDRETPYTRIIEHKHFNFGKQKNTVISYEYSAEWTPATEPYYPIGDEKNLALYEAYRALAEAEKNVYFGGRLGCYKYYDMDKTVEQAWALYDTLQQA